MADCENHPLSITLSPGLVRFTVVNPAFVPVTLTVIVLPKSAPESTYVGAVAFVMATVPRYH
jgi:hypothetical protein